MEMFKFCLRPRTKASQLKFNKYLFIYLFIYHIQRKDRQLQEWDQLT